MNEAGGQGRREWRLAGIIFFALLAVAVLYAAGLILWPFLSAILLGAILVTLTFHWYARLRSRFGGRSTLAAITMLLILTLLLIIPAVVLGALLIQQAGQLFQHLQSPDAQRVLHSVDIGERLGFLKQWLPGFDPASISPQRLVLPLVQQAPGWVARHGAGLVGGLAD